MKPYLVLVAILAPLIVAGCSQPKVVVEAKITNEATGEQLVLSNLPVRLLPYDRDAVFDSLERAFGEAAPPIPAELLAQQQQVEEAERAWKAAEARWSTVRDSVRVLSERTTTLRQQGTASPEYRQAMEQHSRVEADEQQLNQLMQQAFVAYNDLERAVRTAGDSIHASREEWAARAFEDFNSVVEQKLRASGLQEVADTTDANGLVEFTAEPGRWWVYGRYTQTYQELYWNVPIDVTGDSTHIILNRENASVRPTL